jgi:hypothetical protein
MRPKLPAHIDPAQVLDAGSEPYDRQPVSRRRWPRRSAAAYLALDQRRHRARIDADRASDFDHRKLTTDIQAEGAKTKRLSSLPTTRQTNSVRDGTFAVDGVLQDFRSARGSTLHSHFPGKRRAWLAKAVHGVRMALTWMRQVRRPVVTAAAAIRYRTTPVGTTFCSISLPNVRCPVTLALNGGDHRRAQSNDRVDEGALTGIMTA